MKRAPLNLLIDGIAAVLFVGMLATAYVIRYVLPPGTHRVLSLWGMHRHQWGEIHFWLSVGLIVVLLVHLSLHWNWVVTMVKRHVAGDKAPATHLFRAGLATVLVLVTGLVVFAWQAHLNVQPIAESEPVDGTLPAEEFPNPLTATPREKLGNQVPFWKEVYPIFTRSCVGCHGPGKQLGGFRVDQPEDFFGKAGHKPLVVPGNSAASPLIEIVSGARPDMGMAAKHRLPNEEIDLLKGWIDAGADWPPKSQPTAEDKTLTDGKSVRLP
ncbi:MAG: DUF4405 domain-containing protein [Candidatus Paceibacterota bacterium]